MNVPAIANSTGNYSKIMTGQCLNRVSSKILIIPDTFLSKVQFRLVDKLIMNHDPPAIEYHNS